MCSYGDYHGTFNVRRIPWKAAYGPQVKQEGRGGPEIAHLYIGPRGGANFDQGAFIWTHLVETHLKMFHDKYLSSSSKEIF
jgi:hypothetical protein